MKLIVDSSVSLKWWLDDEEYITESKFLLNKIIEDEVELTQKMHLK